MLDALAKPTMPSTISTPDTAMADSTPGSRGAGASKARIPNTKLATGVCADDRARGALLQKCRQREQEGGRQSQRRNGDHEVIAPSVTGRNA